MQSVILSEVARAFSSAVLWPRRHEVEESLCGFRVRYHREKPAAPPFLKCGFFGVCGGGLQAGRL